MFAAADALDMVALHVSRVTAVLHVTPSRATLEMFVPDGGLMHVATTSRIDLSPVRGAWVTTAPATGRALLVLGTVLSDNRLPLIQFWHRRRQVRGRLHRLGSFWLGEAVGARLRLEVDDGAHVTTAKSGWGTGAVPLHQSRTRLTRPLRTPWETS